MDEKRKPLDIPAQAVGTARDADDQAAAPPAPTDAPKAAGPAPAAPGSLEELIIEQIRTVYDPEIPVNIYDLGLIYDIKTNDMGDVEIKMTLTAPGCPVAGELPGWIESAARRVEAPDLMPSDITGTEILDEEEGTGRRRMRFVRGPIFGNIILGDEINRTPPKTQAALLQAMQEYQVTTAGETFELEKPFLVLGTQNPIEQEGTYPLPEAQLDRFMFKIQVDYPSFEEELQIAETTTSTGFSQLQSMLDGEDILQLQQIVRKVLIGRSVSAYAVRLVRATRPKSADAPDFIKKYLTWGAGPRACQSILIGAKANALLDGRVNVSTEDIQYVAYPVLRHRLVTGFSAESDGLTTDHIVEKLIDVTREE